MSVRVPWRRSAIWSTCGLPTLSMPMRRLRSHSLILRTTRAWLCRVWPGIIVRHLVLPGHADDSCRVLDLVWQTVGDVPISVMNQYTPNALMREQGGDLARAVTREEYEQVLDHADDLGFTTMFWQEGGAVDESFTPAFDTTGVLTSAK